MTKIRPWLPPVIALLWVGGLELACAEHSQSTLWAAFVALSIALAIESWKLWWGGGTKAQKITLAVVGGAAVVVALLDTAVYNIARAEHLFITNNEAAIKLPAGGSPEAVCPGCKVLWKDKGHWLLGQPRTESLTCAYGINTANTGWMVPADFAAYAHLVDPGIQSLKGSADDLFLTWQYPRQRFALVEFTPDATEPRSADVTLAVEDNRSGERGIYAVTPFFQIRPLRLGQSPELVREPVSGHLRQIAPLSDRSAGRSVLPDPAGRSGGRAPAPGEPTGGPARFLAAQARRSAPHPEGCRCRRRRARRALTVSRPR